MAISRISDINIKGRGLFTAIYGYVREGEYFVDNDIKNYSLEQALYTYLKSEGYKSVVFYDSADNFHSFTQEDLVAFLKLEVTHCEEGNDDDWEIAGPLGYEPNTDMTVADRPDTSVHDTIQPIDAFGSSDRYFRTRMNINLLDYLRRNLAGDSQCAVVFNKPESSRFENIDDYINLFSLLNAKYEMRKVRERIQNKVIILYSANNAHTLLDNIDRLNGYLFTHAYFRNLFFTTENGEQSLKKESTYRIGVPDKAEIRNWMNRKRLIEQRDLTSFGLFDKINLRLTQERKQIKELDTISLPDFIKDVSSKSAWDSLDELKGIDSIRNQFKRLINTIRRNAAAAEGIRLRPHMCFKGNPGTGKTTVAEIFSEILKEENVVELGQLVRATVGDLVGQYVGSTRIKTQEVCDKAKGGILFIDEAYGLLDSENGFGSEAIEVLIQFMENNRDSLVILAGYTDKIDKLLKEGNDGFSSRFNQSNHFIFEDYPPVVLCEIAKGKLRQFSITDRALEYLCRILTHLYNRRTSLWGNAREVENIIQEIVTEFYGTEDVEIDIQHLPASYLNLIDAKATKDGASSGVARLNALTGLGHMKVSLKSILNSIKADKVRSERSGNVANAYKLNFVFRGNPGTGKTKVARLLGEILTDYGLLSESKVEECRREDIIGQYLGQTAPKVHKKFTDSIGKVLFIDEAYSICNGIHDEYGREAVNAIVGNLTDEKFQGKMAFIIAGYTDEINEFIEQNQGLKSRFNLFIDFDDYSNEELWEIYRKMVTDAKLFVLESCKPYAMDWFTSFPRDKSFSNARLAENLLGITKSALDTRVGSMDMDELPDEMLDTITPMDFPNYGVFLVEEEHINVPSHDEPNTPVNDIINSPKKDIDPAIQFAVDKLLYDYCIIDTNIWMETKKTALYHGRISTLKKLYQNENRKLVAHGSTHEELKKFADRYSSKLDSNKKGGSAKIEEREYCATRGFAMLKSFHKEKIIRIPGLKSVHDKDAYADKDIYDFAMAEFQKRKSILFITNDKDCNMRVNSALEDLKSNDPSLPDFSVVEMDEIAGSIDAVYDLLFKKDKPVK